VVGEINYGKIMEVRAVLESFIGFSFYQGVFLASYMEKGDGVSEIHDLTKIMKALVQALAGGDFLSLRAILNMDFQRDNYLRLAFN